MNTLRRLLEMIRFSHTLFALPFALSSAVLAWTTEPFRWIDLVGILLCMVFARSAAMAFNRLADRRIDAANPRTATRHLPAGTLTVRSVRLFLVFCSAGFLLSTLIFAMREPANPWPAYLSVPMLLFVGIYSLTKRFTSLAHFYLGISLMLTPIAAWIAIRGLVDLGLPLLLGGAVLFWVSGFDILYACQDADFDKQARLHSIPARVGIRRSLQIALCCHLLMPLFLLGMYFMSPALKEVWLAGVVLVTLLLIYEHSLVRADDLSRVNKAFFQVNAVISIGLFLVVLVQVLIF